MPPSFVAYIDESGDEGFHFEKGSFWWFVLSTVVTPKDADLETVKLIDSVRKSLERNDLEPLHFRKLKHEQRLPFIYHIAQANLKTITVFIHKPSIMNVEVFQQRFRLYFYAARLLLERLSWYCRDHKTVHTSGDGSVEIVFSNKGGMKYDELRAYLNVLKTQSQINPYKYQVD